MDSHDIGRGRFDDYYSTLNSVQQPVLVLGIRSDVLYPINEQEELHQYLGNSDFQAIESDEGHDGFLLAQEEVRPIATSPPLLVLRGQCCDWHPPLLICYLQHGAQCSRHIQRFLKRVEEDAAKSQFASHGLINQDLQQKLLQLEQQLAMLKSKI